jgi:hypothetical protein
MGASWNGQERSGTIPELTDLAMRYIHSGDAVEAWINQEYVWVVAALG